MKPGTKYFKIYRHTDPHMENILIIKKYSGKKIIGSHLIIEKDIEGWITMLNSDGYEDKK